MQHWVIGDIHGCFYTLIRLINKVYDQGEKPFKFIFVGDMIDRGPYSMEVVNFVRLLIEKDMAICVRGNHEQMAIDAQNNQCNVNLWYMNGGDIVLDSYKGFDHILKNDIEWFDTLPLYYETETHYICHAGVNPNDNLDEQVAEDLLWIRGKFHASDKDYGKTIVFGHTPVKEVVIKPNYIGIDTGCVYDRKLTAWCLETSEMCQLDKQEEDGIFYPY